MAISTRDYWENFHKHSHSARDFWDWYMPKEIIMPVVDRIIAEIRQTLGVTTSAMQVRISYLKPFEILI